jgi:hypothetical protein
MERSIGGDEDNAASAPSGGIIVARNAQVRKRTRHEKQGLRHEN